MLSIIFPDSGVSQPQRNLQSCPFSPSQYENVRAFSPERGEALQFDDTLPHNSELHIRCTNEGMFLFRGSRELNCNNGTWHGRYFYDIQLEYEQKDKPRFIRKLQTAFFWESGDLTKTVAKIKLSRLQDLETS